MPLLAYNSYKGKGVVTVKECIGCKEEMKDNAGICPHCGERDQSGIFAFIGLLILLVFFGGIGFLFIAYIGM